MAGISGEIIKWRGFFRDTMDMYETIANYFFSIVRKIPNVSLEDNERDVLILSLILFFALIRFLIESSKATMIMYEKPESKPSNEEREESTGWNRAILVSSFFVLVSILGLVFKFEELFEENSAFSALWFIALSITPIIVLATYMIFNKKTVVPKQLVRGLIGFFGVIIVAILLVGLSGAINSGFTGKIQ